MTPDPADAPTDLQQLIALSAAVVHAAQQRTGQVEARTLALTAHYDTICRKAEDPSYAEAYRRAWTEHCAR